MEWRMKKLLFLTYSYLTLPVGFVMSCGDVLYVLYLTYQALGSGKAKFRDLKGKACFLSTRGNRLSARVY